MCFLQLALYLEPAGLPPIFTSYYLWYDNIQDPNVLKVTFLLFVSQRIKTHKSKVNQVNGVTTIQESDNLFSGCGRVNRLKASRQLADLHLL